MTEQNHAAQNHAAHTVETVHVDDRAQYLVVGDDTSLAELQSELSLLPLCARGRVFIEVEKSQDVFLLTVPMRMTVSWLTRSTRSGRPGTAAHCVRGEAVRRAVGAWCAEMLCTGPGNTRAILTGDYHTVADVFDDLRTGVEMHENAITAPVAFRLHG